MLGDVLGSAATNTLIVSALGLFSPFSAAFRANYYIASIFIVMSLGLFIFFTRTKNHLSSGEGVLLLATYIAYLVSEILTGSLNIY